MSIVWRNRVESLLAGPLFLASLPLLIAQEGWTRFKQSIRVPKFDPAGKVILITGASSGIGASLAQLYARQGAILVLFARRIAELEAIGAKCKSLGALDVFTITVDVSKEQEYKDAIQKAGEKYGRLDLVVLNAGISMGARVADVADLGIYKTITEVNVYGTIAGCLYSLPYLRKSERGKVVAVSSILGIASGPFRSGYSCSKMAMKGFLDSIRLEEPTIDFTMIYPGVVKTEINRTRIGNAPGMNFDNAMSAEDAALLIANAVKRRARDEVFTFRGNFLWFLSCVCPLLSDSVMSSWMQKLTKKKGVA
ncbi:hypothetical protein HDU76_006149, partial [Blyttiomyces sp. JEL0837]